MYIFASISFYKNPLSDLYNLIYPSISARSLNNSSAAKKSANVALKWWKPSKVWPLDPAVPQTEATRKTSSAEAFPEQRAAIM